MGMMILHNRLQARQSLSSNDSEPAAITLISRPGHFIVLPGSRRLTSYENELLTIKRLESMLSQEICNWDCVLVSSSKLVTTCDDKYRKVWKSRRRKNQLPLSGMVMPVSCT